MNEQFEYQVISNQINWNRTMSNFKKIVRNILSADFCNKIINHHNLAIFHHNILEILLNIKEYQGRFIRYWNSSRNSSRNWVQVFQHAILRHNKWTICNDPKSRIAGIPTRSGAPAFPVWNRHNMQDAAKCESTRRVRINTLTCVNSHAFTGLRKPPR